MFRFGLRFFLILSLLFNGVAAPWAQAHMRHGGDHAAHETGTAMAGHEHHATAAADSAGGDGDCCEGGACQCGCVLAPALPLPCTLLAARHWSAAPADAAPALALIDRDSPPFRPPAA